MTIETTSNYSNHKTPYPLKVTFTNDNFQIDRPRPFRHKRQTTLYNYWNKKKSNTSEVSKANIHTNTNLNRNNIYTKERILTNWEIVSYQAIKGHKTYYYLNGVLPGGKQWTTSDLVSLTICPECYFIAITDSGNTYRLGISDQIKENTSQYTNKIYLD